MVAQEQTASTVLWSALVKGIIQSNCCGRFLDDVALEEEVYAINLYIKRCLQEFIKVTSNGLVTFTEVLRRQLPKKSHSGVFY